jgi:hypothetical protein
MTFQQARSTCNKIVNLIENDPDVQKIRSILRREPVVTERIAKTSFYESQSEYALKESPLHEAASRECPDIIRLLVEEFGFNVDAIWKHFPYWFQKTTTCYVTGTPLFTAIKDEKTESCKELLRCGADPMIGENESEDVAF